MNRLVKFISAMEKTPRVWKRVGLAVGLTALMICVFFGVAVFLSGMMAGLGEMDGAAKRHDRCVVTAMDVTAMDLRDVAGQKDATEGSRGEGLDARKQRLWSAAKGCLAIWAILAVLAWISIDWHKSRR